jgi:2,4-dienoyl-CoA reductase-like NADH-dependent reductase (Old Yellow Enzyme family)
MFPHFSSPITLRGVTLRNRAGISAHFAGWWADDGLPTQAFADYIEERAKGGIGLFVVGATAVRYDGGPTWLQNVDDRAVAGYRMLAEAAHRHGTRLFAQLIHRGDHLLHGPPVIAPARQSNALPPARRIPVAPPRSVPDLEELIECFGLAAQRARAGRADGIEIHSHESFLHAQLLNPVWNRRQDEYGGTLGNRCRFLLGTVGAIRRHAGDDFPLGVRLKADDFQDDAMTEDEYLNVLRWLEESGQVDYVSLTGGDGALHHGPFPRPDGEWLELVRRVRTNTRMPVMHAGRITTPEMAERAVAEGIVDVVLLTKAHIADPHFTRKAQEGRLDDIRYCTRCLQSCIGKMEHMTCIYNPVTSREGEWAELIPAAEPRRVVVVGAGPAGMEAAYTLHARGHQVTVLERSGRVGGQVRLAAGSPLRTQFGRIWEYYERQSRRLDVRLGVEASAETVLELKPDAVVLATGSRPKGASIPGPCPVLTIHEALEGGVSGASKVLIVDREGFTRPLVVADALSSQGIDVEFITPFDSVSPALNSMTREELHVRLADSGERFVAGEEVICSDDGGVLVRAVLTAEERWVKGVTAIVVAAGSDPVNELERELRGKVPALFVIGDANRPHTVEEATYQGARIGRLI